MNDRTVIKDGRLDEDLEAEFAGVATAAGCDLVHTEYKGGVLRLFIDRPQGVTIADCELVSKQVSALLDVVDFGDRRYVLEVSSPGLDRRLYSGEEYERFVGRKLRLTYLTPGDRKKRTVVGLLESFDSAQGGRATVVECESEERLIVPFEDIQLARLEIEL